MIHVRDVGLKRSPDASIWAWAKSHNYTLITTDSEFAEMSRSHGWPPKIVHIEECDFPLAVMEDLLRQDAVRIAEFVEKSDAGLLSLHRIAKR